MRFYFYQIQFIFHRIPSCSMGGQISSSIQSHSRPRQVEMMIIFVPFLLEFLNFDIDTYGVLASQLQVLANSIDVEIEELQYLVLGPGNYPLSTVFYLNWAVTVTANHVQQGTGQIVVKRRDSSSAAVRKLSLYQYNKVSPHQPSPPAASTSSPPSLARAII